MIDYCFPRKHMRDRAILCSSSVVRVYFFAFRSSGSVPTSPISVLAKGGREALFACADLTQLRSELAGKRSTHDGKPSARVCPGWQAGRCMHIPVHTDVVPTTRGCFYRRANVCDDNERRQPEPVGLFFPVLFIFDEASIAQTHTEKRNTLCSSVV